MGSLWQCDEIELVCHRHDINSNSFSVVVPWPNFKFLRILLGILVPKSGMKSPVIYNVLHMLTALNICLRNTTFNCNKPIMTTTYMFQVYSTKCVNLSFFPHLQ